MRMPFLVRTESDYSKAKVCGCKFLFEENFLAGSFPQRPLIFYTAFSFFCTNAARFCTELAFFLMYTIPSGSHCRHAFLSSWPGEEKAVRVPRPVRDLRRRGKKMIETGRSYFALARIRMYPGRLVHVASAIKVRFENKNARASTRAFYQCAK